MKKNIFTAIIYFTVLCSSYGTQGQSKFKTYSAGSCGKAAIELYDDLIHQEVDLETALNTAIEFLIICIEEQ